MTPQIGLVLARQQAVLCGGPEDWFGAIADLSTAWHTAGSANDALAQTEVNLRSRFGDQWSMANQWLCQLGLVNASQFFALVERLEDQMLTFLEMREAEQMEYGLFDVVHTGQELLGQFPLESDNYDTFWLAREVALRTLVMDNLILRLRENEADNPDDHAVGAWKLRSRAAELVRTVTEVRQRFPWHRNHSQSNPLVRDVKFVVQPRQVPKRQIELPEFLNRALQGMPGNAAESRTARKLLEEVLAADGKFGWAQFQLSSTRRILNAVLSPDTKRPGEGTVVCAGTGSGKTLSFFVPALMYIIRERMIRGVKGTKAIAIYPRVRLAEKQAEEFMSLVYQANAHGRPRFQRQITVAIDYQDTPYRIDDIPRRAAKAVEKKTVDAAWYPWPSPQDCRGYRYTAALCPGCESELYLPAAAVTLPAGAPGRHLRCTNPNCPSNQPNGQKLDFILFSKDDIAADPPDILVISTESLSDRLMSPRHQNIFGHGAFCAPSLIMVDEIHLHTGMTGTQVGYVLRRLRARIAQGPTGRHAHVVGLSATIGEPETFFSELTGVARVRIELQQPDAEAGELETRGAEYFLFVKPMSTGDTDVMSSMIQTTMAVVHQLWRPSGARYKTFAFVNSLDILRRWEGNIRDAEGWRKDRDQPNPARPPLFRMRLPSVIQQEPPLRNYFFSKETCTGCACGPRQDCLIFRHGECWWSAEHGGLSDPARIHTVSSQGGKPDGDLVIATSSLEVGYDDPSVMAVLQYQSPENVASFVQRKGRGGRQVGTRPLMVTVLSPFRAVDVFNYQNHQRLVDPRFTRLPLNPKNPLVRRIHGFYGLFDWLAAKAAGRQDIVESPRLTPPMLRFAMEQTSMPEQVDDFMRYLTRWFDLSLSETRNLLFNGEDGILKVGLDRLITIAQDHFRTSNKQQHIKDYLNNYLPPNLFSDINLPVVRAWDGVLPNDGSDGEDSLRPLEEMPADLGLTETVPGNVSYRFRKGAQRSAYWNPPGPITKLGLTNTIPLENRYNRELLMPSARQNIPLRLQRILPALGQQNQLKVYRIKDVKLERFEPGPEGLTDRSQGFPLAFYDVHAEKESFDTLGDRQLDFGGLGGPNGAIQAVWMAKGQPWLKVKKVLVGAEVNIHAREKPPRHVALGFQDTQPTTVAGLGFELETEGLIFTLRTGNRFLPSLPPEMADELAINLVRHHMLRFLTAVEHVNLFVARDLISGLFARLAEEMSHPNTPTAPPRPEQIIAGLISTIREGNPDRVWQALAAIEPGISLRRRDPLLQIMANSNFCARFAAEVQKTDGVLERHLRDVFVHSLKHALKRATAHASGAQSDRDVAAWTKLSWDFAYKSGDIHLFENGMQGTGMMRSLQEKLRTAPQEFWRDVEHVLSHCPVGDEEELLRQVASLPLPTLEELAVLVSAVERSPNAVERRTTMAALTEHLRDHLGLALTPALYRSLRKPFRLPLEVEGTSHKVENWLLYREVEAWRKQQRLLTGRLPSQDETGELMARDVLADTGGQRFPAWRTMLKVFTERHKSVADTEMDTIQRALSNSTVQHVLDEIKSADELQEWLDTDEQDRIQRLVTLLSCPVETGKRIHDALFSDLADVARVQLYWQLHRTQRQNGVADTAAVRGQVVAALARPLLRETIRRRILASCTDACPECLDTGCEAEPPEFARLTLSRRILKAYLEQSKASFVVKVKPDSDPASLSASVAALFQQGTARVFLRYPLSAQATASAVIARLKDEGVATSSGKPALVELAGSDLAVIDLLGGGTAYEIALQVRGDILALD